MVTRRRLLATAPVALIAGCTGNDTGGGGGSGGGDNQPADSDSDGVPDTQDDFPNDSSHSTLLRKDSESFDLNEDYYQYFTFSSSQPATLSYEASVEESVSIDIILTDKMNFQYYKDGSEWQYYSEGSDLDTVSADVEVDLGTDTEYYLIFDNTSQGGAAPPTDFDNNRVTVNFDYTLKA